MDSARVGCVPLGVPGLTIGAARLRGGQMLRETTSDEREGNIGTESRMMTRRVSRDMAQPSLCRGRLS